MLDKGFPLPYGGGDPCRHTAHLQGGGFNACITAPTLTETR